MRGVCCTKSGIEFRNDLKRPEPGPGEVSLRVRLAGICETDLQLARGYMGFEGVLGHEFVGEDEQGRRWTAEINNACGTCPTCRAGRPTHCPHRTVLGILGHDGAMADVVTVPESNLHAIPTSLSDEEAVFIEPLAAAFRVPEQVPLEAGMRVAVLGDGKLGILCAWVARNQKAQVTLIGKHDAKLALAGPGIAIRHVDQAGELAKSIDVVIDATGSPSGLESAFRLVRPCGTVVLKTTVAAPHSVHLAPIVIDEVSVIGSRCGPFPRAIEALERREIDVRPLLEATYTLDDAAAAFDHAARKGARKILLKP